METFTHIIGIDLGTTNSVVSVLEGSQPHVIHNSEGSTRTPSVVSFMETGEIVVGEIARRQAAVLPRQTIFSSKRLMGRTLDEVARLGLKYPFDLAEHDGHLMVRIGNEGYTPPQVSAFILKKLKQAAEDYLGEPVNKAVITVPAYFDDHQRQATVEAGRLAGLDVLRLLNEPTAAAMAYGLGREMRERVVVYDFGGGTFDITVLDISNNAFEVLTTAGDTHLGGDDIDRLIADYMLAHLRTTAGQDFELDAVAFRRLTEASEKAKCELSVARQTIVHLPFLAMHRDLPVHLEMTLSQADLEKLIRPLVRRTVDLCEQALREADIAKDSIDRVILVGGSTRIPLVQDAVEDEFGMAPFKGINPDEIVAMGAATQGGVLGGKLKEVVLLDVTPHSLGVEVAESKISRVIEKNSTIPVKAAKIFTTTEDEQELVLVHITQGEGERTVENRSLGKFGLVNIQKGKAGIPRIQVTFHINASGMVEVSAKDLVTQEEKTVALTFDDEEQATTGRSRLRPRRHRQRASAEIIPSAPGQMSGVHIVKPGHGGEVFQPVTETQARGLKSYSLGTTGSTRAMAEVHAATEEENTDEVATERLGDPSTTDANDTPELGAISDAARAAVDYALENASSESAMSAYRESMEELYARAAANPSSSGVLEPTVRMLLRLGEQGRARQLLESTVNADTGNNSIIMGLIDAYLEQAPGDDSMRVLRSRVADRASGLDQDIAALEKIVGDDSGTDAEVEKLIELYRERLATLNSEDSETQFKLVKLYVRRGRVDEAINLLQRLARIDEYKTRALKILGLCFWQKGMHYLAWQKFQQLPATEEVKDMLFRLAVDMENTEQYLNARVVLDHLNGIDPAYRDVGDRLERVVRMSEVQSDGMRSSQSSSVFVAFKDSRFIILEEVNRGSMGIVYRAKDKILDEPVALKVLTDYLTSDPVAVERFKREARAAKRLSHPNIVRIHDMFEIGNKKLLSMEFIDGRDLKKVLVEEKTLPLEEVVRIAEKVCDALAYAHKMGIVHRDIKPANILLTDDGTVKVTDFGIAKFLIAPADATRSGSQILGTPLYMSPEQIRGDQVDNRSDLYSMGATLYEMIAGKPPFWEGNIEYHHLHTPPPPLPAETDPVLAAAVLKCLAKEKDDRFQSVDDLYEALEKAL